MGVKIESDLLITNSSFYALDSLSSFVHNLVFMYAGLPLIYVLQKNKVYCSSGMERKAHRSRFTGKADTVHVGR